MNGSCVFSDPPNSSFIYVGVWERERQLIDLAIANDRLLDRRLLTRHGIDAETWRRHLRGGCWERAAPGVWRHRATEETWRLRVCAAMRWLGKEAALHGPTALAWWDLPGRRDDQVHVVLARTRRNVEGPVVVHTVEQLVPADLRRHQGIRLQKPEVAIVAAAAAGWPASMLEETIDEAIRRRLISTGSLSRAAEGVRLAVQHMLCGHGGDAPLPAHQTVGADTVLDFVRRHRLFHSAHAVCAGPAALIDEFLQVLIEGRPASSGQAVVLDPVLTEELQHLGAALDYGLRALMAHATTRALEAVWQREAHGLGELAAGWRGRRTPQVMAWQQRMQRCHEGLDARSAATLTASLQTPLAAATELYSACARGLNALAETDALRAAVITPAAAPAGRKVAELSTVFAQRLGLLPGEAAAELRLLVTGVLTLLATTRAVVAVARDTQAGIQHLLGRAPARRPLQASDLELHDHLFGEPQPRPPQLPAELEAMFGIGLRVSAERIEIDTPRDGPPGEGFVPRSETRTAMREAVAA